MSKKSIFKEFINIINNTDLMTKFIKNIFDYTDLYEYNYIFRMMDKDELIIIDIFDNVSVTRFNRYIFDFENDDSNKEYIEDGIFIKYINVMNTKDSYDKLLKLAYLFKIDEKTMIDYASSFLDKEFVKIIEDIKNKPI